MKKSVLIIGIVILVAGIVKGQQDPQFSKYMFNSLVFNPAYAGSKDHLSVGILHRTQWWGINGAPSTQTLTVHSPLSNDRVGLGFSVMTDDIGPTNSVGANLSYAYRIPLGAGKLAIGLQAGIYNWRADWTKLTLEEGQDPVYQDANPSYWLPNFGAGIYYYTKYFYAGFGAPHLVEYDLRNEDDINTDFWAKQYRHYFFTTGMAIPLRGNDLIFKPSLLIKTVGFLNGLRKDDSFRDVNTPNGFDVDLSLLFYETFWIGTAYRSAFEAFGNESSHDSVDIWVSWLLRNGLRIGAAYDYTLTELRQPARGSFEIMLGYEFNFRTRQLVTPRYF